VFTARRAGGTKKGREFDPRPLDNCKAIQEQQTQKKVNTDSHRKASKLLSTPPGRLEPPTSPVNTQMTLSTLKSNPDFCDTIVWKLHDEQLAAYIAYVLPVSQGEKREIRKLF
jgi:hypothetical protein